jgi:hypothetical protein
VSSRYRLRLLRDNASLTRQAYVEFDLPIHDAGRGLCRFRTPLAPAPSIPRRASAPNSCWLEKWTQEARQRGARCLDLLRDGVEEAITALGSGFLAHPANTDLRDNLNTGTLTKQDYFQPVAQNCLPFCSCSSRKTATWCSPTR